MICGVAASKGYSRILQRKDFWKCEAASHWSCSCSTRQDASLNRWAGSIHYPDPYSRKLFSPGRQRTQQNRNTWGTHKHLFGSALWPLSPSRQARGQGCDLLQAKRGKKNVSWLSACGHQHWAGSCSSLIPVSCVWCVCPTVYVWEREILDPGTDSHCWDIWSKGRDYLPPPNSTPLWLCPCLSWSQSLITLHFLTGLI